MQTCRSIAGQSGRCKPAAHTGLSLRRISSLRPLSASSRCAAARPRCAEGRSTSPAGSADPQASSKQPDGTAALAAGALLTAACSGLLDPAAASAFEIHAEPTNALSLPTWAIHVSSVVEWATAMGLMWRYAEVSGNPRWKGMSWGMLPSLGSAMAACTWHFFYNSPDLEFLVVLQSALTVVGNCTCWLAAYRIYEHAMAEGKGSA